MNIDEQVLRFQNFDLENIVTPLDVSKFTGLLREANYDPAEIRFLEDGFTNGFDIGYEGPELRQSSADNIPLTIGSKTKLWNKLMKEVELGHVAGPFERVPFPNFIQSPIGLVPKAGSDQTRLIFHLSYDNKQDGMESVNHFTPKEKCSVKYRDLDFAVRSYLTACEQGDQIQQKKFEYNQTLVQDKWRNQFEHHKRKKTVVWAGKSDLKSTFRILGLSRNSWRWMIMKAQDPETGIWMYFVDKCLPFGASISCSHFQRFSNVLCHLTEYKSNTKGLTTNYLDDFLFVALSMLNAMQ